MGNSNLESKSDMNTNKPVRADLICKNVPRNAQEQALMDASPSADCSLNAPAVTNPRTVASEEGISEAQLAWEIQELEENIALRLERTKEEQP